MPTIQPSLFDSEHPLPSSASSYVVCAGGCGRPIRFIDACDTPEGGMCDRCFDDLYTQCEDCGKLLRYDNFGDCDNLQVGPDRRRRCNDCDRAIFFHCRYCGRTMHRENNEVCTDPNDSTKEFCHDCWNILWFTCTTCNNIFAGCRVFYAPNRRDCYCEECFSREFFRCASCGGSFNRADICGWEDDPYCEDCYGHADVWKVQPWGDRASKFIRVGSKRCYGVELETRCCNNYKNLQRKITWGCVYECSTPGREFVSPILQGDEGFDEIREMCRFAADNDWSVDDSCGTHIHLDACDLSSEELLQVAYSYRRTYPLWKRFVGIRRSNNSMCGSPQYRSIDVRNSEHFEDFVEARDRFEFLNWRSYLKHGSVEIRLYKGTLNSREICNWIAIHTRFIDAVKDLTYAEIDEKLGATTKRNWRGLNEIISDVKLLDYWRRKASRLGYELEVLEGGE